MNKLPYPTKTRLRLAASILAGHIRHYHFIANAWSCDTVTDNAVTARVREFVEAGLAEIPKPDGCHNYSLVVLTDAGREWNAKATTPVEGPGSTSPEPGPSTNPRYAERPGTPYEEPSVKDWTFPPSSPEPGPDVLTITESEVIGWITEERKQWAAANPSMGHPVSEAALTDASTKDGSDE